jgi:hypothetical protein
MTQFQTYKKDITKNRLVDIGNDIADFTLGEGEVLTKIERFSFTANNVTYGAVGDQIGYWKFFQPHLDAVDDLDWGIVPVWGFGEIVASNHPEIRIGERCYGYFPISNFLIMKPIRVNDHRFVDGTYHRSMLPGVYNNYDRLGSNSANASHDNLRALLNPLYGTSFCLVDVLQQANFHNAEQVIILSASSKTAIGLAFGLSLIDDNRPKIVGLTSASNVDFIDKMSCYDFVIGYDNLDALPNTTSVLVDMSGNRVLTGSVHQALGDNMLWCHNVGLTHWDNRENQNNSSDDPFIQERSAMFFAPEHIAQGVKELGALEYNKKVAGFLNDGITHANGWMQVTQTNGLSQFAQVYDRVVRGDMHAKVGNIIIP